MKNNISILNLSGFYAGYGVVPLTPDGAIGVDDGRNAIGVPIGLTFPGGTVTCQFSAFYQGKITSIYSMVLSMQATITALNAKVNEMYQLQGLQVGSPSVHTRTSITAGAITLQLSGDGENTTTVTRA
jgi:hypothetical protein